MMERFIRPPAFSVGAVIGGVVIYILDNLEVINGAACAVV